MATKEKSADCHWWHAIAVKEILDLVEKVPTKYKKRIKAAISTKANQHENCSPQVDGLTQGKQNPDKNIKFDT